MGCNAWNHSRNCMCDFRGGHSSNNLPEYKYYNNKSYFRDFLESYTFSFVCECGETIWFYHSPYGGKVFFDNLGWPWPKHNCLHIDQRNISACYQATLILDAHIEDGIIVIVANVEGEERTFYLDEGIILAKEYENDIRNNGAKNTVFFVSKNKDNLYYDVAFAKKKNTPYKKRDLQDGLSAYDHPNFPRKQKKRA